MTTASPATAGSSFRRATAGVASVGIVAGLSLVAASPAMAASDVDCTPENTVDGAAGAAAFQTLLDANAPVVCLTGTLSLTDPLLFNTAVTIYGLGSDAVLDGNGESNVLQPNDGYDDGVLTLQNLRVTGGSGGGWASISGGPIVVTDSRFDNNSGFVGGAIAASTLTVTNSVFENNSASFGGAILVSNSGDNLTVTGSTFTDNTAEYQGGAIQSYGVASISASTFVNNTAEDSGGAVWAYGVSSTNSTYFANSASRGGALYVQTGGTVLHSTFLDNTADNGQSLFVGGGDVLDVRGNIFAGSSELAHLGFESALPRATGDGVVTIAAAANGLDDLGGNVFSTPKEIETILPDPTSSVLFGTTSASIFGTNGPANNGGQAQTIALIPGSPAINAVPEGSPAVDVDERGIARGAFSDAGAYEYESPAGVAEVASLPDTGVLNSGWLLAFGALLAAAGAVVVGAMRRTSRTR